MENKQRPQDAWDKKKGLISKSYKLPESTVIRFAEKCKQNNVSIGKQLAKLMDEYNTKDNVLDL